MSKITACKFLNESNKTDNEELIVGTEWDDLKIKLLIITSNNKVLMGEIFLEEFHKYARTFEKSIKEYLKDTEDILSGKNQEVQFFLEDHKFYWKRRWWNLGEVSLKSVNGLEYMKDFTMLLIDEYTHLKSSVLKMQTDNQNLQNQNTNLLEKLDELVVLKKEFENKLYKKFILLINTKKAKIKELKNKLDKLENKDSVYNRITDESNESDTQNNFSSHSQFIGNMVNKRSVKEDLNERIDLKRQKLEEWIYCKEPIAKQSSVQSEYANIKAKLSKNKLYQSPSLREDEETPDLLSDESECEVELKFDEENAEDCIKTNIDTTTQEDSEEEMF